MNASNGCSMQVDSVEETVRRGELVVEFVHVRETVAAMQKEAMEAIVRNVVTEHDAGKRQQARLPGERRCQHRGGVAPQPLDEPGLLQEGYDGRHARVKPVLVLIQCWIQCWIGLSSPLLLLQWRKPWLDGSIDESAKTSIYGAQERGANEWGGRKPCRACHHHVRGQHREHGPRREFCNQRGVEHDFAMSIDDRSGKRGGK